MVLLTAAYQCNHFSNRHTTDGLPARLGFRTRAVSPEATENAIEKPASPPAMLTSLISSLARGPRDAIPRRKQGALPKGRAPCRRAMQMCQLRARRLSARTRSEEHTSELQSRPHLVC